MSNREPEPRAAGIDVAFISQIAENAKGDEFRRGFQFGSSHAINPHSRRAP